MKMSFSLVLLIFFSICSCTADSAGFDIPSRRAESLLIDNLDVTFSDFLSAYKSDDVNQERFAQMYLIGLLDATEGVVWCEYSKILPSFIEEYIPISFQDLSAEKLKDRASDVILKTMSKYFPCKKE